MGLPDEVGQTRGGEKDEERWDYQEVRMSLRKILYAIFVVVIAGAAGLSGAALGGAAVYQLTRQQLAASQATAVQAQQVEATVETTQSLSLDTPEISTTVTEAVQKAGAAVVTVEGAVTQQSMFGTANGTVSGSGVFISQDGYIITNNHVIDGAKDITVTLADGTQEEATVVGTDVYADLAVLKVNGKVPAVAALANSDTLKPGETVIAIGSPLGEFQNTVTVGVVSATSRSVDTGTGFEMEGLIQTDAAINSGNSGGPLVNLAGEVVGINTLMVRSAGNGTVAEGLGFSIPANTVKAVTDQIIQKGYFSRPYLGVRWQMINPEIAKAYQLTVEWGVYVSEVVSGSPAGQAGILKGDIITKIGDVTIDESHGFMNSLFNYKPGDTIDLEVERGGETVQLQVTLTEANAH
jgi:2-alkenal reductase